jgi:hypothetical protein
MFEQSSLWRNSLAAQNDQNDVYRERLRGAYLALRENAKQLVNLIPPDCKGLTVHDVTHLDALWEMGSLICGERFELNPCEAYVFGAAVLLHDAGMSVASYPEGLPQLVETIEWRDNAASVLKKYSIEATADAITNPPPNLRGEITFQTLRNLHAKHAEELVNAKWPTQSGKEIRLIEDQELRTAFGASIGRIAHSHHWPIEKLVGGALITGLGAPAFAPAQWTVNEIKIACMLRCSDAAHMDRRRAPSLTYALTKPTGVSDDHWRFQNKLNKPTIEGDSITYATGESFELSEARAWWLCYDTLVMLDDELRRSNAVLRDNGAHPFHVRQVSGASDPTTLSRYIRVNGWKPVDAEIRVTNPIQLAQTLGGKSLYGNNPIAPVRELLQNAVDSVRARRLVSKRASTWGSVRLRIEKVGDETWLNIDDTGIGMSEATLTGALLDFGNSFWRTQALRDEWPGLESSGLEVVGKFGIGFFSVFLLGDRVKVVSRRCDAGKAEARLLEFENIRSRPIVRSPNPDELLEDYVTTVSVKLDEREVRFEEEYYSALVRRVPHAPIALPKLLPQQFPDIARLIAGVDVEISLESDTQNYRHLPNWVDVEPTHFLREIGGGKLETSYIDAHKSRVRVLRSESGVVYGRAALSVSRRRESRAGSSGVSVGGFVVSQGEDWCVGLLTGDTSDASRISAKHEVPGQVIAAWATEQADLLTEDYFGVGDRIIGAERIDALGGDPKGLPFAFCGGTLVTRAKLLDIARRERKIHLLLGAGYDEHLSWLNIDKIHFATALTKTLPNLCALGWRSSRNRLMDDETNEILVADPPTSIDLSKINCIPVVLRVTEHLTEVWGTVVRATLDKIQIFDTKQYLAPEQEWVLTLEPS